MLSRLHVVLRRKQSFMGLSLNSAKRTIVPLCTDRRFYSISHSLWNDGDYPPHEVFPMPALSPTMESGSIESWALSEGDSFEPGQVLCSIETDKASVDFEAQDEGVLAKILHPAGSNEITCGTPICVAVEDADDVAAFADFKVDEAPAASGLETKAEADASEASTTPPPTPTTGDPSILFPSARHLAESKGLDATGLQGSGKGGRVTKGDVMQAIEAGSLPQMQQNTTPKPVEAAPVPKASPTTPVTPADIEPLVIHSEGSFEDVANNKMRKIIATRLTESKATVPHMYTSAQIPLDGILALRKQLAAVDVKVSVNDFIIRASALALRDVPAVNSMYDSKSGEVTPCDSVDVSVAVATPTGLITPIVHGSDKLGLSEITSTVRDLATRARDGALAPHEYQGGTFSVSNLGMFGIKEFSAVINPPQAAILAVGGGTRTVVPAPFDPDSDTNPSPQIQTLMTARLSSDRRVVDEATASLFLSTLSRYLTQPELLLL